MALPHYIVDHPHFPDPISELKKTDSPGSLNHKDANHSSNIDSGLLFPIGLILLGAVLLFDCVQIRVFAEPSVRDNMAQDLRVVFDVSRIVLVFDCYFDEETADVSDVDVPKIRLFLLVILVHIDRQVVDFQEYP